MMIIVDVSPVLIVLGVNLMTWLVVFGLLVKYHLLKYFKAVRLARCA